MMKIRKLHFGEDRASGKMLSMGESRLKRFHQENR